MLIAALAVTVALVVADKTPLRATAHANAPRQTTLSAGDWLEVRGEGQGFVQVYDHRRERPGYVRPESVRRYALDEAAAPKLAAVVEYLRDAPGQESLGIGYAALFLRAAPPQAVGAEIFDALGTMAARLGHRASAGLVRETDGALAAQLEVAQSYGAQFARFEQDGETHLCYDGDAFRRVLALGGSGPARVRAALGLTEPNCADPSLGTSGLLTLAKWWTGVLDAVDPENLGPEVPVRDRALLRLRRSIVEAELSYYSARSGDASLAKTASESARRELELVDRATLSDEDRPVYEEAALHTAGARWAREDADSSGSRPGALSVEIATGAPGQTCVRLRANPKAPAPLFEHCTYAIVWPSSVRIAPHDAAVAIVTQPLVGWNELLVLRPHAAGWAADTIAPAAVDPELGYVEPAGFSPDGTRLLVVREARVSGPLGSPHTSSPRTDRRFQVLATEDQRVEKQSTTLGDLASFRKWQAPEWRRGTLALR